MALTPAALVMKQPDLGTAGMLLLGSGAVFFCAGVRWWKFALLLAAGLASGPIAWQFLHDYQKDRVLTFLNPENDPLGAGYHTLQAMIGFRSEERRVGTSVSVRVDLGGRRIIKKKK